MMNNYFEVLRGGVHSSFQDSGFENLQHLGIAPSGAIDYHLLKLANKLLGNNLKNPVLEFANQGPLLKLKKGRCRFSITGNVAFNIINKKFTIQGVSNRTYYLNEGDFLDILSTIKSNYGYFTIEGGFNLKEQYGCFSTLTQSQIGTNQGKKITSNQIITFDNDGSKFNTQIKIDFNITKIIRVIRGPQMNYFMQKMIKKFYKKSFIISKSTNRIGVRIEDNTIKAVKSHDIASEGITKGAIQVPGSGDPIVLLNDHPTIGGYPKIAIVILSDISKLAQFQAGTYFNFEEVTLSHAENIYKNYTKSFNRILKKITNI